MDPPKITSTMIYHTLIIGFVCYALIGVAVAMFGPVRTALDEAVAELREAPAIDDDSDGRSVSQTKVLLFRAVLSVAIVLLWWHFLFFVLRPHAAKAHSETAPRVHGAAER
jgi:Flp pilus assembly pilin Flp